MISAFGAVVRLDRTPCCFEFCPIAKYVGHKAARDHKESTAATTLNKHEGGLAARLKRDFNAFEALFPPLHANLRRFQRTDNARPIVQIMRKLNTAPSRRLKDRADIIALLPPDFDHHTAFGSQISLRLLRDDPVD